MNNVAKKMEEALQGSAAMGIAETDEEGKQIARGLSRGKRYRHTKLYFPAAIDYHGLYAIERCADRFFLEKDLAGDGIAICSRVWHIACHTQ